MAIYSTQIFLEKIQRDLNILEYDLLPCIISIYNEFYAFYRSCNGLQEDEVHLFVDFIVMHLNYISDYVKRNNSSTKESHEALKYICEIIKIIYKISDCAKDAYLKRLILAIFETIIDFTIKIWFGKELLVNLNDILQNSKQKLRNAIAFEYKGYLGKLVELSLTCGDYDYQVSIMETIFRLCSVEQISKYRFAFFTNSETLRDAFQRICKNNFDQDIRKFLNTVNVKFKCVFSIRCQQGFLDNFRITAPKEPKGTELWIDFNSGSNTITILCNVEPHENTLDYNKKNNGWESIAINVADVSEVSHIKIPQENSATSLTSSLIAFRLKKSYLVLNSSMQKAIQTEELKLMFLNSLELLWLINNVLPVMFQGKFKKWEQSPEIKQTQPVNANRKIRKLKSCSDLHQHRVSSSVLQRLSSSPLIISRTPNARTSQSMFQKIQSKMPIPNSGFWKIMSAKSKQSSGSNLLELEDSIHNGVVKNKMSSTIPSNNSSKSSNAMVQNYKEKNISCEIGSFINLHKIPCTFRKNESKSSLSTSSYQPFDTEEKSYRSQRFQDSGTDRKINTKKVIAELEGNAKITHKNNTDSKLMTYNFTTNSDFSTNLIPNLDSDIKTRSERVNLHRIGNATLLPNNKEVNNVTMSSKDFKGLQPNLNQNMCNSRIEILSQAGSNDDNKKCTQDKASLQKNACQFLNHASKIIEISCEVNVNNEQTKKPKLANAPKKFQTLKLFNPNNYVYSQSFLPSENVGVSIENSSKMPQGIKRAQPNTQLPRTVVSSSEEEPCKIVATVAAIEHLPKRLRDNSKEPPKKVQRRIPTRAFTQKKIVPAIEYNAIVSADPVPGNVRSRRVKKPVNFTATCANEGYEPYTDENFKCVTVNKENQSPKYHKGTKRTNRKVKDKEQNDVSKSYPIRSRKPKIYSQQDATNASYPTNTTKQSLLEGSLLNNALALAHTTEDTNEFNLLMDNLMKSLTSAPLEPKLKAKKHRNLKKSVHALRNSLQMKKHHADFVMRVVPHRGDGYESIYSDDDSQKLPKRKINVQAKCRSPPPIISLNPKPVLPNVQPTSGSLSSLLPDLDIEKEMSPKFNKLPEFVLPISSGSENSIKPVILSRKENVLNDATPNESTKETKLSASAKEAPNVTELDSNEPTLKITIQDSDASLEHQISLMEVHRGLTHINNLQMSPVRDDHENSQLLNSEGRYREIQSWIATGSLPPDSMQTFKKNADIVFESFSNIVKTYLESLKGPVHPDLLGTYEFLVKLDENLDVYLKSD